ncbi:hypothetical protein NpNSSI1_00009320 [Neofusicoccum parvum]|nr:hypothetical protein NpNSSI1_00009320 [Neofusicoccum parvum]
MEIPPERTDDQTSNNYMENLKADGYPCKKAKLTQDAIEEAGSKLQHPVTTGDKAENEPPSQTTAGSAPSIPDEVEDAAGNNEPNPGFTYSSAPCFIEPDSSPPRRQRPTQSITFETAASSTPPPPAPPYLTAPITAIGTRELVYIPLPPELQQPGAEQASPARWAAYLELAQAVAEMVPVGVLDDVLAAETGGERNPPAASRRDAYLRWLGQPAAEGWRGLLLWVRCAHERIAEARGGAGWAWKAGGVPEGGDAGAVAWIARKVRDEQVRETRGLLVQFWGEGGGGARAVEVYRLCLSAVYRVLCQP